MPAHIGGVYEDGAVVVLTCVRPTVATIHFRAHENTLKKVSL